MQNENILQENFEYFLTQKDDLLKDATKEGKFVVVYEKALKGFFETFESAYGWAIDQYTDENFIIQKVVEEKNITNFVYELQCR